MELGQYDNKWMCVHRWSLASYMTFIWNPTDSWLKTLTQSIHWPLLAWCSLQLRLSVPDVLVTCLKSLLVLVALIDFFSRGYASFWAALLLDYAQLNSQNISTASLFSLNWSVSDFLHAVYCRCVMWALFPVVPPHCDSQTTSSAVDQLNIWIVWIQQQFDCI